MALKIAFPPLCPGELFESWLLWLCAMNHDQSGWLIQELGVEDAVTQGLALPDHAFYHLHEMSEVSEEVLRASHVRSYADTLGLAYGRNYGIRGGLLKAGQVAYKVCPECLIADERPFIRLAWALDMTSVCPVHLMPLLFDCPHCGKPLRLNLREPIRSVAECRYCGKDCRTTQVAREVPHAIAKFQQDLLTLPNDWFWLLADHSRISASSFVRIAEQLFWSLQRLATQSCIASASLELPIFSDLLDDRFSVTARHINAFMLCAWFFEAPKDRAQMLTRYLQSPQFRDPTRQLLPTIAAFQNASRALEQVGMK